MAYCSDSTTDTVFMLQVADLWPINSMRNAALLLAATPLVFSTDVDMLLSRELSVVASNVNRRASCCGLSPQASSRRSAWSQQCNASCILPA